MKKSELASQLAERANLSKNVANSVITSLTEIISEALADGDKVQLTGFGTWSVRERAARRGVNPSTGDKISIPAKRVAVFKASSALSDRVA